MGTICENICSGDCEASVIFLNLRVEELRAKGVLSGPGGSDV